MEKVKDWIFRDRENNVDKCAEAGTMGSQNSDWTRSPRKENLEYKARKVSFKRLEHQSKDF